MGKRYTDEFMRDAVRLVTIQGYTQEEAAERLGISKSSLRKWKKKFAGSEAPECEDMSPKDLAEEVKRLHKECRRLEMEREIFKKAAAFFAKEGNEGSVSSGSNRRSIPSRCFAA